MVHRWVYYNHGGTKFDPMGQGARLLTIVLYNEEL
jgi:hypothetical protein